MVNSLYEGETVGVALRGVRVFMKTYKQLLKIGAASNEFSGIAQRIYLLSKEAFDLKVDSISNLFKIALTMTVTFLAIWFIAGGGLLYISVLVYLFQS